MALTEWKKNYEKADQDSKDIVHKLIGEAVISIGLIDEPTDLFDLKRLKERDGIEKEAIVFVMLPLDDDETIYLGYMASGSDADSCKEPCFIFGGDV